MSQFAAKSRTPAARSSPKKEVTPSFDGQTLADDSSDHSPTSRNAGGAAFPAPSRNFRSGKDSMGGAASRHLGKSSEEEEEEKKHILANRYKTKMCKNYVATGACPYEERCMFAHGEEELRTAEQNIADGLTSEEAIKAFKRRAHLNAVTPSISNSNGGRFASLRNGSANTSRVNASRHNNATTSISQAPALAPCAAAAAQSEEMPMMAESDFIEEPMIAAGVVNPTAYMGFRYRHNPYNMDLLAPQDHHYTAPYGANSVADDFGATSYFPAEEVLGFEDSLSQPCPYVAASSTMGAAKACGCIAEDLYAMDHDAEREMILEP